MKAGKMTVLYKGEGASVTSGSTDIDKIFLDDTVFLTSGTQQATAEKGEFDMTSQTFVLSGKQVVLSEGANVFRGCKLTVQMATGQAKLDSCGGRVEIMLDPKSRPKQ
jgi:lipopolysaccharide export system protein LptA